MRFFEATYEAMELIYSILSILPVTGEDYYGFGLSVLSPDEI